MTTGDLWIVIPSWDKFQTYGDRAPPWIKLYTDLNSNDEWLDLGVAARGMLATIWVEYARSRGQLRVEKVMGLCGKSARSSHVQALNHAGFIELSAKKPQHREEKILREEKKAAGKTKPKSESEVLHKLDNDAYFGDDLPADPDAARLMRELANRIGGL